VTSPTTPGALIRRTLLRQRRLLLGSVSLITLWQVCEAAVPVLIGVVIDQAVATGDVDLLVFWAVVLQVGPSVCRRYVEQSSDVPQRV